MKNSFVLYTEYEEKLTALSNEQFGALMRAIFQRESAGEVTIELDAMTQMALGFIAGDLDRTHKKYMQSIENGKRGGRPKTQNNPGETRNNPGKPGPNLNVDVDVNEDVDVDEDVDEDVVNEIVRHLNMRCKTQFKPNALSTKQGIIARLKEGFTLDNFKEVIDKKHKEWSHKPDMAPFLRPQTLFGNKFESYLNQPWPQDGGRKGKSKTHNYPGRKWDYDYLNLMEQAHVCQNIGEDEEAERLRKAAGKIKMRG